MPTTARLLAAVLLAALAAPAAAHASQFAYTADSYDDVVRVYQPLPGGMLSALGTFPAGDAPVAVALSPDGRSAYAANSGASTISTYDVHGDGTLTAKTPDHFSTGAAPSDAVASPDGTRLYVLEAGALQWWALDHEGDVAGSPHTLAVTGAPTRIEMSPDGASLYLLDRPAGTLTLVRATAEGVSDGGTVTVGPNVWDAAVRNDGSQLFATGSSSNGAGGGDRLLYVFDRAPDGTLTQRAVRTGPVGALGGTLTIDPDDGRLRTANGIVATWPVAPDGSLGDAVAGPTLSDAPRQLFESADGDSLYMRTDVSYVGQFDLGADGEVSWKMPKTVAASVTLTDVAMTPQADLAVTQALPTAPAAIGRELTYKIVVTNVQGMPATQVAIRSAMPDDLTLLSASTPGGTCAAGTDVDCLVPVLPQGHSATVTVRARAVRTGSIAVSASAYGLQPDPDVADNTQLATMGVEPLPGAVTAPASDVTSSGATLNAVVAPAGTGSRYRFELGTTDGYGAATSEVSAGDGTEARVVSAAVRDLVASTTYHYRVVVLNDQGAVVDGADGTFTTAAAPAASQPPAQAVPPVATTTSPAHGDTTALRITSVVLSPTSLRLRLSEAGEVRASIAQRRTRRVRIGGRLRTVTRWVTVRRATIRAAKVGTAAARIARLSPGRYRVTLRATDAAGNRSAAVVSCFTASRAGGTRGPCPPARRA